MKTEYVALTPSGAAALVSGGMILGLAIRAENLSQAVALALAAIVLALYVRSDAKGSIADGTYREHKCVWRRSGEGKQTIRRPPPEEFTDFPTTTLQ